MDHAARMKEAQLKEKPERREWEAAPAFFKWTCGDYPHVLSARNNADFAEKLSIAESFKQEGNKLVEGGEYDDALMK
jgi:hypothetical protein